MDDNGIPGITYVDEAMSMAWTVKHPDWLTTSKTSFENNQTLRGKKDTGTLESKVEAVSGENNSIRDRQESSTELSAQHQHCNDFFT